MFGVFGEFPYPQLQLKQINKTNLRTAVVTGFLVRTVSANVLVTASTILTGIGYILFAIASIHWPYWYAAFPAILLSPISADGMSSPYLMPIFTPFNPPYPLLINTDLPAVLYTTSMLIVTSVFPPQTQSLAGGVFNTVSQIGNAVGLAAGGVIAASVTASEGRSANAEALLKGYHATFWACFTACAVVGIVSMTGLRRAGKVGLKID